MVRKSLKRFKGHILTDIAFEIRSDFLILTFKNPKNPEKVRYLTVDCNDLFDADGNRLSTSGIKDRK